MYTSAGRLALSLGGRRRPALRKPRQPQDGQGAVRQVIYLLGYGVTGSETGGL